MEKAYIRDLNYANQCELVFPLKITGKDSQTIIEQHIRSVRQSTDNIQSLLDHTKNKINKLLEGNADNIEINISLTQDGIDVPGDTQCKTFIVEFTNVKLNVCNQTFDLVMNAPLVQSVTLPIMSYVNYVLQPTKFKTLYADRALCEFFWYTSPDKLTWTEVGYTFKYKPTSRDLNNYLKFRCIPKNTHAEGPPFEIVSEMTVEAMSSVPECPFQKRHEYTKTKLNGKNIRVVSYNTLSNRYSGTNAQFPYCSPQALSIDYRKQLILKELLGYNADIMCLQEVDHFLYQNYFKPKLSKSYKSIFHKKGNRIPEGLACFYNNARFKMVEAKQLVFSTELKTNSLFKRKWNLIKQIDTVKDCIAKQPTSLQLTILKSKEFDEIILVANTHLYYHSEANDVRLLQASLAMDYLKSVFQSCKRSNKNSRVSVIFCGDFNSVPTSAVYDFFTNGVVQHTFEAEKGEMVNHTKLFYNNFFTETPIRNICLNHSFQFASAYGTPKYTNYTDDFKGCLDYIFYDKNSFKIIDCVPLPDESVLAEKTALPNEVFPSDHLALIANLKLL